MSVDFASIIRDKKLGRALTKEQLRIFADGAGSGSVPDYQLASLLMAIRLNGMNAEEITQLTLAMRDSGDVADLSSIKGVTADKHSTGGVGDNTSFIVAPLVSACGAPVAMMSGRGLGHTGGTLDKLEAINGFNAYPSIEEFIKQINDIGVAIIGQSGEIAPADKKLYALRDVTSTVDSIPLIASSIMSKKLASGTKSLVLDVKTGSGAMMQRLDDSIALAQTMVDICKLSGVKVTAVVTDMNQPLGTYVGNGLELKQSIDVLKGESKGALYELSLLLGSYMLVQSEVAKDIDEARKALINALSSGAGLAKLKQMIEYQGGDSRVCDDTSLLPQAKVVREIKADTVGYVESMDTVELGLIAQSLGAGRQKIDDDVDYSVGYILPVRIGDYIDRDTTLCVIHARSESDAIACENRIRKAIKTSPTPVKPPSLVYAVITEQGVLRYN
ncbi:MAG: thymidine phosphorylase [Clostridia bacterium]|nr:thymidine phosphorylase [Clostridia bacterium]